MARTVGASFAACVREWPDEVAVVDQGRSWTYRDLGTDVDSLSRWLVSQGVGPEIAVGVLARRSYPLVVAMLAVLRAGGAFVPLNPDIPAARLRFLVADVRPALVLTEIALVEIAEDLGAPVQRLIAGLDGPAVDLEDRHRPGCVAYVIQTSGSTGEPRSVQVEMRALVNLLAWYCDVCDIGPGVRVGQMVASSFDASVKNYLAPLVAGASLVLLEDGPYDPQVLLDFIKHNAVSVLNPGVPSAFYPLVELAGKSGYAPLNSIRYLALGAEVTDVERLRPWLEADGCEAHVLNVYGPTEGGDIACYAQLADAHQAG